MEVRNEVDHKEDRNAADIDAMLHRTVSVPQTANNCSGKNARADSAMQRMSILIIKTRNAYNGLCLSKERSFLVESLALALVISVNL
jgi:hypothetical protein